MKMTFVHLLISDTSTFLFRGTCSIRSQLQKDVPKSPYNHVYIRLACQSTPSQHPPLHPLTSYTGLNIVDDLKLTKS